MQQRIRKGFGVLDRRNDRNMRSERTAIPKQQFLWQQMFRSQIAERNSCSIYQSATSVNAAHADTENTLSPPNAESARAYIASVEASKDFRFPLIVEINPV